MTRASSAFLAPDTKNLPPEKPKREQITRLMPRVLALTLPQARLLSIGLVALAVAGGINLLFPYLIREVLNGKLGVTIQNNLLLITFGLIVLFIFQAIFFYIRHYCFVTAGYTLVADLRRKLYKAILSQDISFFDKARTGDLLSRLSADTQLVQRALTINVSVSLRYILQVIGGIYLMVWISPKLSLVILLLIPLLVVLSTVWGKRLKGLSKRMQEQLGEASVAAEEALGAIRTVRIFAGEDYENKRHDAAINEALSTSVARTKVAAIFSSSMVFLIHSSIAIVIGIGGTLILQSQLTIGDLTAFLLYCVIVAVSFGFLASAWEEFLQAVGASERIFELIDSKPSVVSPENPRSLPPRHAGSVEFKSVSFAYPGRPDMTVLKNVNFRIDEGNTVAFVGPSGAGKSTIGALIQRFYDVSSGSVSYCGFDVRELELSQLRADISVVSQESQVFSVSIRDNIAYGKIGAAQAEIESSADAANIHNFVKGLPLGYDTLVGDRGVQLSAGQRQRICIARAILKNPRFLILDEATSALDSENEQLVQSALKSLMHGRTTLIIAHRLSTVQHADKVFVVSDGEICQQGTHRSLVGVEGIYQNLVQRQLLADTAPAA